MLLESMTWKMSMDLFLCANQVLYYCGIQVFLDYPNAKGDVCNNILACGATVTAHCVTTNTQNCLRMC